MHFTALIADDEAHIRRTIKAIGLWDRYPIEIIGEATDGLQAFQMITEKRPDIVFLDMRMPGLDGIGLLKRMETANLRIKVMVVSGYDDFAYAHQAIKYGASDYILKPINRDEFNESLKRIVSLLEKERTNAFEHDIAGIAELQPSGSAERKDILNQIFEDILQHYQQDISLSTLADKYFVSKEFLSRAFKKRYGFGITTFINENRLNKAKELLQHGYKVHHAADMVGYNDVNYFSKQFKKYTNRSPSEYSDLFRF